jgi:GT2 family glycosyltransferase
VITLEDDERPGNAGGFPPIAGTDMNSTRIVAVVVLYKRKPERSETINSLAAVFERDPELLRSIRVLIWDNSPTAIDPLYLPFACDYIHAGSNVGTSGAYNKAMEFADAQGSPWLLLLDQDTVVSNEFLPRMLGYSYLLQDSPEIGSVVPFIYSHAKLVSPRLLLSFNRNLQIPLTFHGICRKKAFAINSTTLVRVAALKEIGGYSEEFWLDLSDVYAFHAMYLKGRYIYVASDLVLQHSLSGTDYDKEMTCERYRNFLAAEGAFVDLYSSPLEQAAQLFRLFIRIFRQYRRYKNKAFALLAWEYFLQRLFHGRAARLRKWRQQLAQRDLPVMLEGQLVR